MLVKEKSTSFNKIFSSDFILEDLDKALETALFYGFIPIKSPLATKDDQLKSREFNPNICMQTRVDTQIENCHKLENKISLLRMYLGGGFRTFPFPLTVCYRDEKKGTSINNGESFMSLSILGANRGIAEAIALKASLAILKENRDNDLGIEINSIGDKESFSKFEKEFNNHMKKKNNAVGEKNTEGGSHERLDTESLLDIPKPLNYLNSPSIKHFKEVLEFMEGLKMQYDLNHTLIPNKQFCHQTVFRIKDGDETVALGLRHQSLVRKLKTRKEVPFLTVVVKDNMCESKKISIKKMKPKFFLVQFGNKAKIKSLEIIEGLRKASMPVYHSLTRDKLTGQLTTAESLNFPYILIVGEKEALEESVVVRNAETRVQKIVPISGLATYLKNIRI